MQRGAKAELQKRPPKAGSQSNVRDPGLVGGGDRKVSPQGSTTRRLRITGSPLGTGNHTLFLGLREGNDSKPR